MTVQQINAGVNYSRPALYKFAFCPDFNNQLKSLAIMAPEQWESLRIKSGQPFPILYRYIHHTFQRIKEEYDLFSSPEEKNKKICMASDKACFNTGLYTSNYEPIYGLFGVNGIPGKQQWYLIGFFRESDYDLKGFACLPERADYFNDAADLIYDYHLDLRIQIDHILDTPENFERIPQELKSYAKPFIRNVFEGAISTVKKKLAANYTIAIPQFYNRRVQLLIPLDLFSRNQADLALAIYREEGHYSGRTCLTLDMAYNNARLIVKPESEWLQP